MTRPETKKKNEGPEAFEAFAIYRDMGIGRSNAAVAQQLGKSKALMDRWSSAHSWVKRVHAHDLELDRRKRLGDLRAVETMRKRQTMIALKMQDLGYMELEKMLTHAEAAKTKRSSIDDKLVLQLIDQGAKLERLNRGEPGEIVQANSGDGIDLSGLTLAELKTLRAVRSKIRARQLAEEIKDEDE